MINPGTSEVVYLNPGVGIVKSQTLNPTTPVEVGRTVVDGVEDAATEGSSLPISWWFKWLMLLLLQVETVLPVL